MLKLKEKNDENISKMCSTLLGMQGNVEQIKDIQVHLNIRTSPIAYDLMMIAKYDSFESFNGYVSHPYHVEVGKYVADACEKTANVVYEI
jgi:hypothetical protein